MVKQKVPVSFNQSFQWHQNKMQKVYWDIVGDDSQWHARTSSGEYSTVMPQSWLRKFGGSCVT